MVRRRGKILTDEHNMHEKPATLAEVESLWKLKAELLSAHDVARLLEWLVNNTPAQSLDRETCERVCHALVKHGKTAGPTYPLK
jgi:hypothetical protein